jgi:hypothetical protein
LAEGLSEELLGFIRQHVSSIEQLEVLLLLRRDPAQTWEADGVAAELRIQPRSAAARLDSLTKAGLARHLSPAYVFDASNPELTKLVDALAEAYQTHRVTVIQTIFAKPADNVRVFADAFLLSKGGKPR